MKKRLFAIAILFALTITCLCACNGVDYGKLNKTVQNSYSEINLTVEVTLDGETLTSTFHVKNDGNKSSVDYKVEQLVIFVEPNIPMERKREITGGVIVQDGKVTQTTGEAVEGVDFESIVSTGISFKKSYFENAQMENEKFTADVVRPGMFMGSSVACSNMKVTVILGETPKMEVTYTSTNNAAVKLTYEFVK